MKFIKKILPIILVFLFISEIYAVDDIGLRLSTINLAWEVLRIRENNPTHKQEAYKINNILKTSLDRYVKKQKSSIKDITSVFETLYNNGVSEYEDSPDARRMKKRRALCFASIALRGKEENRITFIEYAQFALIRNISFKKIEEGLENEYLGLLLLKILLEYDDNQLAKDDLLRVREFIDLQSTNLAPEIIRNYNNLLNRYDQKINKSRQ